MPWDNQSSGGGGWKSGNGGPWGQPPRNTGGGGGGGPTPPDLEELLRRSQDRLKSVLPGGSGRKMNPLTIIAILTVVAALLAYNFFTFRVQPDEVGVVLLFGKYDREAPPGLNFRLPYPIETVYTPRVTRVNRVTIGQFGDDTGSSGRDIPEESLMLTGDENIVDIDFSVFWVIDNARNYLFNMEDPQGSVKAAAESAMREVVGRSNIQPLLTQARQITESDVRELIQQTMDHYEAGVQITQVQLLKVDPPSEVIAAFRDVQAARADQERLQNEAQTYANRVIPEARGQASQITESAIAYRDRITNEAQGQADRFTQVYESYRAAPEVTRQRMYLETLADIFAGTSKVIIDESGSGTGVVPYLPLDQLQRRGSSIGGGN
ncbi:MAG: FtsH protease activity modulator HflK [Bauldia sp.]|uniref:FtsH protease activity modulator HflK n=1 Tax=Bauldia sp. TaxID=2575872 RepID=UPI001DD52D2D|nr:FtsH protease activity modulator HflK [Bauldia sp.]MCB1495795.1 FtsH protease activity modulator HflK [Bauldia sp.]